MRNRNTCEMGCLLCVILFSAKLQQQAGQGLRVLWTINRKEGYNLSFALCPYLLRIYSPLYLRCCKMGMMVSSGMLWARNSCQVLYCSKVSHSSDWTVEIEDKQANEDGPWPEKLKSQTFNPSFSLRMLSTESFRNITRFPIITWHISSCNCTHTNTHRWDMVSQPAQRRRTDQVYYLCGVDNGDDHVEKLATPQRLIWKLNSHRVHFHVT